MYMTIFDREVELELARFFAIHFQSHLGCTDTGSGTRKFSDLPPPPFSAVLQVFMAVCTYQIPIVITARICSTPMPYAIVADATYVNVFGFSALIVTSYPKRSIVL